ncbi:pilin [Dactylosporangium sp. NPDC005555]|uniref:pilin n=1 Tax=Dactylosporangium sp. NPDC005555 TaxID=3154889 RepID=UPI0033B11DD4
MYRTVVRVTARVTFVGAVTTAVLVSGGPVYAGEPVRLAVNDLPTVISNLTNTVTTLLAAVATLFLTIGGFRRVTSGGDPAEVEKSNQALRSAAIGYALAVMSPVLLTLLKSIVGS